MLAEGPARAWAAPARTIRPPWTPSWLPGLVDLAQGGAFCSRPGSNPDFPFQIRYLLALFPIQRPQVVHSAPESGRSPPCSSRPSSRSSPRLPRAFRCRRPPGMDPALESDRKSRQPKAPTAISEGFSARPIRVSSQCLPGPDPLSKDQVPQRRLSEPSPSISLAIPVPVIRSFGATRERRARGRGGRLTNDRAPLRPRRSGSGAARRP